jgi:hypothetical protein
MSFHEAADYTTKQIAELNVPLYLGLSGGMDSEYAFLCFHRNKIDIVPIIVKTHGNDYETAYAFHLCKKLNVIPIVLTISENEYVMLFNNLIADKLNGIGLNSVSSILAGFYAQKQGGLFVDGNHLIEDGDCCWYVDHPEWDSYSKIFCNEDNITFFAHNPSIAYSMIDAINGSSMNELKHILYDIPFRPKIKPIYNDGFYRKVKIHDRPDYNHIFGHRDLIIKEMNSWNV